MTRTPGAVRHEIVLCVVEYLTMRSSRVSWQYLQRKVPKVPSYGAAERSDSEYEHRQLHRQVVTQRTVASESGCNHHPRLLHSGRVGIVFSNCVAGCPFTDLAVLFDYSNSVLIPEMPGFCIESNGMHRDIISRRRCSSKHESLSQKSHPTQGYQTG